MNQFWRSQIPSALWRKSSEVDETFDHWRSKIERRERGELLKKMKTATHEEREALGREYNEGITPPLFLTRPLTSLVALGTEISSYALPLVFLAEASSTIDYVKAATAAAFIALGRYTLYQSFDRDRSQMQEHIEETNERLGLNKA